MSGAAMQRDAMSLQHSKTLIVRHQQLLRRTCSTGAGCWSCSCARPLQRQPSQRRIISCNAAVAAEDGEYSYERYPAVPGDNQSPTLYTALTSAFDQEASGDFEGPEETLDLDDSDHPDPEHPKGPRIPQRWKVVIAIGLAFVLCNMDKVNMSVAVLPMSKELGWSALDRGLVNSAFFYGYALTQIPAGWISTRIGGAKVLLAGVFIWSLGTLLAPPAAKMGLLMLCASRVLVGLGEGVAPSAATNVLANTIPERERARAVTAVFGSLDVGSAVGLTVCGPLINAAGWPSVFILFGLLGLIWCAGFPLLRPDSTESPASLSADQSASATSPRGAGKTTQRSVPWAKFMQSSAVWAVVAAHFCFNYGYYTLLAWLPSYFQLALGLNIESSSLLTLVPYLAMIAATPFVGPVADGLVTKGWSLTRVRKLCQGIAFAGPLLCMAACAALTPNSVAAISQLTTALIVGILSVSFACGSFSRGGLYCVHQDINPKYASALLGISNTAGALPGIIGVSAVGVLLDRTGSWAASLFLPIGAAYVFGLIWFTIWGSSERQEFT